MLQNYIRILHQSWVIWVVFWTSHPWLKVGKSGYTRIGKDAFKNNLFTRVFQPLKIWKSWNNNFQFPAFPELLSRQIGNLSRFHISHGSHLIIIDIGQHWQLSYFNVLSTCTRNLSVQCKNSKLNWQNKFNLTLGSFYSPLKQTSNE